MDFERFLEALTKNGITEGEARYYASHYPRSEWAAIVEWSGRPPSIDACDDVEADLHYGL